MGVAVAPVPCTATWPAAGTATALGLPQIWATIMLQCGRRIQWHRVDRKEESSVWHGRLVGFSGVLERPIAVNARGKERRVQLRVAVQEEERGVAHRHGRPAAE